jgi:hypothetical protein
VGARGGASGPITDRGGQHGATEATLPAVPCSCGGAAIRAASRPPHSEPLRLSDFEDCVMTPPSVLMRSRAAPKTARLLRRPTVGACECPSMLLRTKYRDCVHRLWQERSEGRGRIQNSQDLDLPQSSSASRFTAAQAGSASSWWTPFGVMSCLPASGRTADTLGQRCTASRVPPNGKKRDKLDHRQI